MYLLRVINLLSTLCAVFLQFSSFLDCSLQGYSLLTTSIRYDTYFVRDKIEKLDFQLRDKAIKLRGLETITYKGTAEREMQQRPRESPSLARGRRAVPTNESSQLQDLEIRLPETHFQTGDNPENFMRFMSCLLDQRLQRLCCVQNVKQAQRLRSDIRMGSCFLLLVWDSNRSADEEANKRPWLFLREMNTELGRAIWWCGQGKILFFLKYYRYHR